MTSASDLQTAPDATISRPRHVLHRFIAMNALACATTSCRLPQGHLQAGRIEHQESYTDPNVLASTLYCLVRIALHAT